MNCICDYSCSCLSKYRTVKTSYETVIHREYFVVDRVVLIKSIIFVIRELICIFLKRKESMCISNAILNKYCPYWLFATRLTGLCT